MTTANRHRAGPALGVMINPERSPLNAALNIASVSEEERMYNSTRFPRNL